jgi:thiamine biosynthesis protein ThiI
MAEHLIIIRPDEISIKGRNRPVFERRLMINTARALGISPAQVKRERGRVYIHLDSENALEREGIENGPTTGRVYIHLDSENAQWVRQLERVFGVKNFSPAIRVPATVEAMEAKAVELAAREAEGGARTFKVETRRGVKTFPMTSMEINAHLGRFVLDSIPQLAVDVHEPEFVLRVEIRRVGILFSTRTFLGPGGLPVGVNGKALLLLSGGIDSPVAGWMLMKRGVAIDAVYFHSPPYTSEKAREKVFELARVLSRWKLAPVKVHIPFFTEIQMHVARVAPAPLWTVLHRRFMHRIAERIAGSGGYDALATGESIGQVASQTVRNLDCIDRAVGMLVLRPLAGFDKFEIVTQAKRIGTYEISVLPYEDCCALFAPKNPQTNARVEQVEAAESQLDVEGLIIEALTRMEAYSISHQTSAQPENRESRIEDKG